MSADEVDRYMDAAVQALEAGDYSGAIQKAVAALGKLSARRRQAMGGQQSIECEYTHESIREFLTEVKRLRATTAGSVGFRSSKINFNSPGRDADC